MPNVQQHAIELDQNGLRSSVVGFVVSAFELDHCDSEIRLSSKLPDPAATECSLPVNTSVAPTERGSRVEAIVAIRMFFIRLVPRYILNNESRHYISPCA